MSIESIINGKRYPMWSSLVAAKAKFIGGKMIEHESMGEDIETIITDITLEPNGKDSAMIQLVGKDFTACCDVKYCGLNARKGGGFNLHAMFGTSWEICLKP